MFTCERQRQPLASSATGTGRDPVVTTAGSAGPPRSGTRVPAGSTVPKSPNPGVQAARRWAGGFTETHMVFVSSIDRVHSVCLVCLKGDGDGHFFFPARRGKDENGRNSSLLPLLLSFSFPLPTRSHPRSRRGPETGRGGAGGKPVTRQRQWCYPGFFRKSSVVRIHDAALCRDYHGGDREWRVSALFFPAALRRRRSNRDGRDKHGKPHYMEKPGETERQS